MLVVVKSIWGCFQPQWSVIDCELDNTDGVRFPFIELIVDTSKWFQSTYTVGVKWLDPRLNRYSHLTTGHSQKKMIYIMLTVVARNQLQFFKIIIWWMVFKSYIDKNPSLDHTNKCTSCDSCFTDHDNFSRFIESQGYTNQQQFRVLYHHGSPLDRVSFNWDVWMNRWNDFSSARKNTSQSQLSHTLKYSHWTIV